ncbi:MAG: hypothetical protein ACTHQQ_24390, partial [Solirubrobacteraceae bacterium]
GERERVLWRRDLVIGPGVGYESGLFASGRAHPRGVLLRYDRGPRILKRARVVVGEHLGIVVGATD